MINRSKELDRTATRKRGSVHGRCLSIGRIDHGIGGAVIYADCSETIMGWNYGVISPFGCSDTEALGQTLDLIIPVSLPETQEG